ncbi:MAG: serine/threonine protein kinase, partial [Myxococcota bacterium]
MPPTNTTIGARLGPYRIEALVGEGGMAAVYRAVHTDLGSMHAIKVLTVPTTVIRARLLQEGRIQARLDHPNVVRVTGTVEVDGGPALVLDFVDGPDLGRILHGWRPTLDQVDFIARGVLAGAGAAHAIGSIHRDLKPANILLDLSSGEPAIKVADFGIAKLLNEASAGLSRTGAAMGTPAYMSPEQARGADDLDPRSDVFSLGCILYELLTGQRAFDGRNALTVMRSVMSSTPVPAETLAPDAPARMHRAIAAALHKNRVERPADAAALCALWTDDGAAPPPVNPWDDRAREAVSQLRKAPP